MTSKYTLNAAQQAALAAISALGESDDGPGRMMQAHWWGRNPPDAERVYFQPGRKDAKLYIRFDDPALLTNPQLVCYLDDCGQTKNWYATQKQKIEGWAWPFFQAVVRLSKKLEEGRNTPAAQLEQLESDARLRAESAVLKSKLESLKGDTHAG